MDSTPSQTIGVRTSAPDGVTPDWPFGKLFVNFKDQTTLQIAAAPLPNGDMSGPLGIRFELSKTLDFGIIEAQSEMQSGLNYPEIGALSVVGEFLNLEPQTLYYIRAIALDL